MLPSTCGSGWKIPGRSTGMSRWSCGATTMKMISRTRTTSTSGVTFMSGATPAPRTRLCHPLTPDSLTLLSLDLGFPPGLAALELRFRPALDAVEQLARSSVQRGLVLADLGREVVEREHRRNRDGEAERGFDQRFRDAGRHGRQAARPGRCDALERTDDPEHGAQQSHERRD